MELIKGTIESIVFKSEDSGYVVFKLQREKDIITAVGILPYIQDGITVELKGEWTLHPQFGRQFKIEECEEILPSTEKDIEKYLSSGVIKGIGPVTAKKIINKFGEKALEILDNDIEKLRDVEGIGEKKFRVIIESYSTQRELKNVMMFFQTHGVTVNQCMKIYKRFGSDSVNIVKENPYLLCEEISGIGFKSSDRIAKELGVENDSSFRVQSGIQYVINKFCANGNTFVPKNILIESAMEVLTVNKDTIEKNIYDSIVEEKIKIQEIDKVEAIFSLPFYYCELGITSRILTLSISNFQDIDIDWEFEIKRFEEKNEIQFATSQKEAIIGAFQNGIEIITGGPGTGKTTIIKCIIEIFEKCGMKVMLGAPTGRAAKRMSQSTGREAKTIHRMLEMGVGDDENSMFSKNESSPLEADVVIIDEASMIDITLMNTLLKAIKVGTRVIIVGDVDQLPSVGPGNVLSDLIESQFTKVVRLKEIFRQGKESMIIVNAHRINEGQMPFLNEKGKDFYFLKEENMDNILTVIVDLIKTRLPKFNKDWNSLKKIQILAPMKKGTLGVTNLNKKLQEILNPKEKWKKEKAFREMIFRVGDKVMQTKNNYSLKWIRVYGNGDNEGVGVFNGDMGFIESIDDEERNVTVVFDDEKRVVYDQIYLDELDLAYAITIHKSQGSEFPVVIMPSYMGSPLLMNRNLLYTGITRAKEMVVVVGIPKGLKYMVDNTKSNQRYSSLKWRIKDIISNDAFSNQ